MFTPGRSIPAVPSNNTPPIVLAVASLVAATAVALAFNLLAARSYAAFTPAVVA